jgi:hypothetical protein
LSDRPEASSRRWSAVVVLGAGRSGTSAITRALPALGVELGDRLRPGGGLRPGGAKNPTGFFEDEDLLAINKRLKKALGIRGESVALIESDRWNEPRLHELRQSAVETIRRRFGECPLWGYKYGRTLRLLPFWEEVYRALDLDVRYLVALRNPLSVARSRARLEPRRGTQEKSDLEWLVNVVPYFRRVRERPFAVVDYDLVMTDPVAQLRRMAGALGLPRTAAEEDGIREYAERFLRRGMRHSRFTIDDLRRDERANRLAVRAYAWLHRLAIDEIDRESPQMWEDWARIEESLGSLAPVLRHIDRIEGELRRARLHPMGPLQAAPHLWRRWRRG